MVCGEVSADRRPSTSFYTNVHIVIDVDLPYIALNRIRLICFVLVGVLLGIYHINICHCQTIERDVFGIFKDIRFLILLTL